LIVIAYRTYHHHHIIIIIVVVVGEPLTGAWPFPQAASIILYLGRVAMLSSVRG